MHVKWYKKFVKLQKQTNKKKSENNWVIESLETPLSSSPIPAWVHPHSGLPWNDDADLSLGFVTPSPKQRDV